MYFLVFLKGKAYFFPFLISNYSDIISNVFMETNIYFINLLSHILIDLC